MGEVYWPAGAINVLFSTSTWLCQTFTPLWTHEIEYLRFNLAAFLPASVATISLQDINPDDTPTGIDLLRRNYKVPDLLPLGQHYTIQDKFGVLKLLEGKTYALIFRMIDAPPFWTMATERIPAPSGYTRGKLTRSYDGGTTWDPTDFGDLLFGEFGDPPLKPTIYNPPLQHWAVVEISQNDYLTATCFRIATTEPCYMKAHFSWFEPGQVMKFKPVRGATHPGLDHYSFISSRYYYQKEAGDSLYHTFYITGLKKYVPYWLSFTADSALNPTISTPPFFKRIHPDAPPFAPVRRPNGRGDVQRLAKTGDWAKADAWMSVKEATPDEWLTGVGCPLPFTKWWYDLYNMADIDPFPPLPIEQVHLTCRCAKKYGYAYGTGARIVIRTHGMTYYSPTYSGFGDNYSNRHWHLYENPFTHQDWTQQEVNDLQIGIRLRSYEGVGWAVETWCTQLYAQITHKCEAYN